MNKYYAEQISNTNYIYGLKDVPDEEYDISVQNYVFMDKELPNIISNYFIANEVNIHYFCSVIWNKIDYKEDNYNVYDYDPDPKCIVYVDNLSQNLINKYLHIVQTLGDLYEPTTEYKHFNPALEKIPLSTFIKSMGNENIIMEIKSLQSQYNE